MSVPVTGAPTRAPRSRAASLRGIDGLRAIAALTVVIHHTGLSALEDGTGSALGDEIVHQLAAGVLLFFTLTGLLLYRPFADAIVGTSTLPRPVTFLRNRALRIIPAYWAILLIAAAASATVVPHPERILSTGSLFAHPGALLANLLLVQGYAPSTIFTGVGPAWTLVVEVGFYLTLPVVATAAWWAAGRTPSRRGLLVFLPAVAFAALGIVGKGIATAALDGDTGWSRTWASVVARSFLANADLFATGMAIAAVAALVDAGRLRLPSRWRLVALVGAAVAAAAALGTGGEFTEFRYDQLGTIATALAIAPLVIDPPTGGWRAVRWLEHRTLAYLGLVSYSVYLWHQPVIDWWVDRGVLPFEGGSGLVAATALVGAMTLVLSALTYRFVERPALSRKRSIRR